jgi:PAS domain S-box-containing protein
MEMKKSDMVMPEKPERDLKEQYLIMQGIMNNSDALIYSVDRDYKYTSYNHRHALVMKQIYGREPEIGISILDIISVKEDREKAKSNLDRALAGEQIVEESYSGEELLARLCFRISHSPVRNDTGEVVGTIVLAQDITGKKRSEEALRKSEEQYRLIAEYTADTIAILDLNMNFTYISPSVEKLRGYTAEETMAQSWDKIFTPDSLRILNQLVANQITVNANVENNPDFGSIQLEEYCKNGSTVWVEIAVSAIRDNTLQPTAIVTMTRDISKRRQAQEELKRTHEELKRISKFNEALLSAIPTPVFYKDREGRYLGCNRAFSEFMGVTTDRIKGKTVYELWPKEYAKVYDSRDQDLIKKPERQIYEFKVKDKDGLERPVIFSKDVFRDENGRVEGIVGAFMDITERKRAEEALRQSEEKFRILTESSPTAILLYQNNKWVYANPAAMEITGYTEQELQSMNFWDIVHPDDKRLVQERGQKRQSGEAVVNRYIFRIISKGGKVKWVSLSGATIVIDGNTAGIITVFDITERKHTEMEITLINRTLRLLSDSNQALIHITDETSLLNEVCRILVETGGYHMAWVGLMEYDEQKSIRKAAQMGNGAGYIESTEMSWADNEQGHNPCGNAIRSGQPCIVHDIRADSISALWQKAAVQHGYMSIIALPLIDEGETIGALGIYAGETDAFNVKEIEVLMELANDLAFGISTIRSRARKKQAEEALRISEENYRILFEDNPAMYFTVNREGMVQSVNRFVCEQLGYSYEELIGKPVKNMFLKEDQEQLNIRLQKCIQEPYHSHSWELRIVHKNGRVIWVRETAKVITSKDGNLLFLIVCEDITEYKQSQAVQEAIYMISESTQTTSNINELFDSIHAIIGELMPARNFYIALYNRVDELISFPYYADEFDTMPPPVKIGRGLTDYVICTGKPLLTTPEIFEELVLSGKVESVGTPSVDWLGVPLKTRQGETIGLMAVQTYTETVRLEPKHLDIMEFVSTQVAMAIEHKQAEEDLQHSEEKYRVLVENLTDVIFTLNAEGKFIYISPAIEKYTGFTAEQVIGKSFIDFIFPDDLPGLMASFQRSLNGQMEPYDFRVNDTNGRIHYVHTSTKLLIVNDKPVGLTGIMSDITQRKKDEEELLKAKEMAEESNRLKSAFLATMNHELRTPLNHILGFSDLMRSGSNRENITDYADIIYKSSQNLLEIIEGILELALAEQSEIQLRLKSFKCLDLFISNKSVLTEILENSGKKDRIELFFNADKELLLQNITSDKTKINQVLINLFKNAVKFTKSGKIEFGLYGGPPGWITFYVEDTGIGIPENMHDIVFEFFRQADDSNTREFGGIGIGLAISKKIAEVMKGTLSLESIPGKGSRFIFKIPVVMSDFVISSVIGENRKIMVPDLKGKTVLIAEDDPISFNLIKRLISRTGAEIIEASNGKEAIEKLAGNPDIVLMDLNMPVMDGYEATRRVKSGKPGIPVIAVTAYALYAEKSKAIEAGCNGIISKPIDQRLLYGELKKYLLPE